MRADWGNSQFGVLQKIILKQDKISKPKGLLEDKEGSFRFVPWKDSSSTN